MKSHGLLISFITHCYAFLTGDDKNERLDVSLVSPRVASFMPLNLSPCSDVCPY
jgi:hypothetical protein